MLITFPTHVRFCRNTCVNHLGNGITNVKLFKLQARQHRGLFALPPSFCKDSGRRAGHAALAPSTSNVTLTLSFKFHRDWGLRVQPRSLRICFGKGGLPGDRVGGRERELFFVADSVQKRSYILPLWVARLSVRILHPLGVSVCRYFFAIYRRKALKVSTTTKTRHHLFCSNVTTNLIVFLFQTSIASSQKDGELLRQHAQVHSFPLQLLLLCHGMPPHRLWSLRPDPDEKLLRFLG